jgi:hypothetical protein
MCYESGWFWRHRTTQKAREAQPVDEVVKQPPHSAEAPKTPQTEPKRRERDKVPA